MKRNLTKSAVLLFIGALLGASLVASLNAAQSYWIMRGWEWRQSDDNSKVAYLFGYLDAELSYRLTLDKNVKPFCDKVGRTWIETIEGNTLTAGDMTVKQAFDRINEFYKDPKNQGVLFSFAGNIVKMQAAGKPRAEIEKATQKARDISSITQ
ncbi:MAG: hypothetical protein ABSE19_01860 [Candidatus Acidiferrum sp.]|jgi:hypothetical protein